MIQWKDITMGRDTRLVLYNQQVVRPLDKQFHFRPSGDLGPAGVLVLCRTGRTVPETDPDIEMRGEEEVIEVFLGQVMEIISPSVIIVKE